jgi:osmotically-inducible protein OsmY
VTDAVRDPDEPIHYLIQRVREALAHDPRVGELELGVNVRAGKLYLTGTVHTDERRTAAAEVARRVAPDLEVHNQLQVLGPAQSGGDDGVERVS